MKNKISVIVPIYNSEKYLQECLESLKNQDYNSYEVILIDDGSTDKSKKICETFTTQNSNFKLYSQENLGASSARNMGISKANGEYIIFVDSDDYCKSNMLEELSKKLKEDSLLAFGYIKKYRNKELIVNTKSFCINNKNEIYEKIFMDNAIGGNIANKVFSAKIIKQYNIKFNLNIHYCEDMLFLYEYVKKCNEVIYIEDTYYYYRMRKSSVSFNFIDKKNVSILDAYSYIILDMKNNNRIIYFLMYNYLLCYMKLKKVIGNYSVNKDIVKKEKKILQMNNLSFKDKFKYYFIYKNICIWKYSQKIKNIFYKLYQ